MKMHQSVLFQGHARAVLYHAIFITLTRNGSAISVCKAVFKRNKRDKVSPGKDAWEWSVRNEWSFGWG